MRRKSIAALLALSLVECGRGAPEAPSSQSAANKSTPTHGRIDLEHLSQGERSAVLFRAISDAQSPCSKVVDSAYQQLYKGMHMFVARCPEAGTYAVFVSPNDYAQVSACSMLGSGVPACFEGLLKVRTH